MMKDNLLKLKKASNEYVLNDEYGLTEHLLTYIKNRIEENRNEIDELIKIRKENITLEQIFNLFQEENHEQYKNYKNMKINNGFLSVEIQMPLGVIAVEAYKTLEVIRYFVKSIQTRNAIAISDVEYDEDDVKHLILLIIKEALKKFKMDENLIIILPFEECFYEEFDEVIYTYNKQGELLQTPRVEKKQFGEDKFIYIEDEHLRDNAIENTDGELIDGNLDEVLNKIHKQNSAVIYTTNLDVAYKFINLAHCKNVFVNTNLINEKYIESIQNNFYENRHIIIPIPKEDKTKIEKNAQDSNTQDVKLTDMIVKKQSIFEKIKSILKAIFNK